MDADTVVDLLSDAGVPAGLVYRAPEMLADLHIKARDSIVRVADDHFGDIAMQGCFPRLSRTPGAVRHTGPVLGAHTDEVLRDWAGIDADGIAALRAQRVI